MRSRSKERNEGLSRVLTQLHLHITHASPPSFLSTLLPPTSSALSHLLTRGGFPPAHNDTHEPAFMALLEETRDLLTSSNFALVLERALDRATSVLFDGLSQNVFVGEEGEEGEVRLRTASVLPGLVRWSSLALNGLPNELVDVRSPFFSPVRCLVR
jgi:peroxin-3